MGGGLAGWRGEGDDAGSDLRAGHRFRRGDRHRDAPLRPAGDGDRAQGAERVPVRTRVGLRRATGVRLRPRIQVGVRATRWPERQWARRAAADGPTMKRIGIDVGGTNTDAVLLDGEQVAFAMKTPTTADVLTGVRLALEAVAAHGAAGVQAVMIGTTHFVNA